MDTGFIGLKGHASVVVRGMEEMSNCRAVAVSDDDGAEVDSFVKKNKALAAGAQTYRDWRHLVEHTMMDVCCVCDEIGIRAEQLIALAERGCHVVSEKPLASNLEDLERVRKAFAKSKGRLTMLLTMRHEPKYATMRRLVKEGAVGNVALATAQKSYRLEERPEWQRHRSRLGGTIPFIGIHATDLMRWITGLDYTHVAAFHGNMGTPELGESEDHASLLLRFANGGSATARLDFLRPQTAPTHGDDRIRIAGTEGVIEARQDDSALLLMTGSEPPHRVEPEPTDNLFVEFANAIREGRPSRIPAEECYAISELVLRARDAADQQQMIELPSGA